MDADAWSNIGPIPVDLTGGAPLADIDERIGTDRHAHAVRSVQIIPLSFELAVAVEHLDPMVLAVGDIDPAVGVATNVVRNVELAGIGARLAPRHQQFAVRGVFMNSRTAVAVGDVEIASRGQGGVRAAME